MISSKEIGLEKSLFNPCFLLSIIISLNISINKVVAMIISEL
jgi:hypothetical protein